MADEMKQLNWNSAIYYGEVFGFLFAWAVCLAVMFSPSDEPGEKRDAQSIASADAPAAPQLGR